jgi:hypothetical protein
MINIVLFPSVPMVKNNEIVKDACSKCMRKRNNNEACLILKAQTHARRIDSAEMNVLILAHEIERFISLSSSS